MYYFTHDHRVTPGMLVHSLWHDIAAANPKTVEANTDRSVPCTANGWPQSGAREGCETAAACRCTCRSLQGKDLPVSTAKHAMLL
jgi:hypothetical protein